jgi:uncharacterized protein (TIGR02246 family)
MNLTRREAVLAAVGAAALAVPAAAKKDDDKKNDSTKALRALLKAHNEAFTSHDLDGVLATLAPDCAIMGTGPGELWVGHEEIKEAYSHFFEDFDKGQQQFESLWHHGNVGDNGAWLMTVSKVTLEKGSKEDEFGLNLSLTCEQKKGKWLIQAMHFSNLVSGNKSS